MKIVCVIPARFGSTRFPGKPLVQILGKPMIQWVVEKALKCKILNDVIVATDHLGILEAAKAAGAKAVMTDSDLPSGSDRIFAAIKDVDCDVVINIQGDEPLIKLDWIEQLAQAFVNNEVQMATLAHPLTIEELENKNSVKVLVNQQSDAIYFSRYPIPYSRMTASDLGLNQQCLKHIGIYAYRKNFLQKFCSTPVSFFEKGESLEQLRALDLGARIKVIPVSEASIGIDTPEDLIKVEKILMNLK